MGEVLIAPARRPLAGPLVFLAGPTWTSPWQDEAIAYFQRHAPDVHLANPRRPVDVDRDFDQAMYEEQVDWETEHLQRAGADGVVLFWLAAEQVHRCERAYAQTTRFELAEWKECHRRDGVALALGIEAGFTGARYIRRRFAQECPTVALQDTLEATCREAIALIRGRMPAGHASKERRPFPSSYSIS